MKQIIYFLTLILALPIALANYGYGMMYGYQFGYSIFGIIFMILFWGLIIWLIIWFINKTKQKESPLDILNRRYAKGEITKKQYEEMKKEINK